MKRRHRSVTMLALSLLMAPGLAKASHLDTLVSFRYAGEDGTSTQQRDWTPPPGAVVDGTYRIVVDASASSSLKSFRLSITRGETTIPEPAGGNFSSSYEPGATTSDRFVIPWDTNLLTPYNGTYNLIADAESQVGDRASAVVGQIKVNNPPAKPIDITASLKNKVPVISWTAGNEPDLLGYAVYRSVASQPYKQIGDTEETRFTDNAAPADKALRYSVVAIRRSPIDPEGIVSEPSLGTSAIAIVTPGKAPPDLGGLGPAFTSTAASAEPTKQKHRGGRFSSTLPYDNLPALDPQEDPAAAGPDGSTAQGLNVENRLSETVNKLPFIAAGLFFLVAALQVLRVARKLVVAG